jgi:thymidylate kinase
MYKQTPAELMLLIRLFHVHKLSYILFKCEHIFAGANKNLDILFETDADFHAAARVLEKEGYVVRFSEKFEKYKLMYCGLKDGNMYSVHLHREIAWHGIVALDKKEVFARKQTVAPLIIVPGVEDSILIHAAHAVFENFKVTDKELFYLHQFSSTTVNKNYILAQASRFHWKRGFLLVVRRKKELTSLEALLSLFEKCAIDLVTLRPGSMLSLFNKLFGKFRVFRRRGCLIVLIGVNGAGKSTLARKLLEAYAPLTAHLGISQKGYYYGWEPFSPVARVVSWTVKKKKVEVFEDVNKKKSGIFHEFVFVYNYVDYLLRYIFKIYPATRRGLVVTDRYFYDLYGQYTHGPTSKILPFLMKMFPKPDSVFVLDAPMSLLVVRRKENKLYSDVQKSAERTVKDISDLEAQRERYFELKRMFHGELVDTTRDIKSSVGAMVEKSWRVVVRD